MKKLLFLSAFPFALLLLLSACRSSDFPPINMYASTEAARNQIDYLENTDHSKELKLSYRDQMAEKAETCEHWQDNPPSFVGVEGGHKTRCKYCKTGLGNLIPHEAEAFQSRNVIVLHGEGEATLYEARCRVCRDVAECYFEVCLHNDRRWVLSPISNRYRKTCNDCGKQFGSLYDKIPEGET